jgi:hypothetical protein
MGKQKTLQSSQCCKSANETVIWGKSENPDKETWIIDLFALEEPYPVEIFFCPFCGKKLEPIKDN